MGAARRRRLRDSRAEPDPPARFQAAPAPTRGLLRGPRPRRGLHCVVQPDLVVVTERAQISDRGIEGLPALVVEVLSPSTEAHDRTVKARRCAALGLRHYWVVDPATRRLECYRESAGQYALVIQGEGDKRVTHEDWPSRSAIPCGRSGIFQSALATAR